MPLLVVKDTLADNSIAIADSISSASSSALLVLRRPEGSTEQRSHPPNACNRSQGREQWVVDRRQAAASRTNGSDLSFQKDVYLQQGCTGRRRTLEDDRSTYTNTLFPPKSCCLKIQKSRLSHDSGYF